MKISEIEKIKEILIATKEQIDLILQMLEEKNPKEKELVSTTDKVDYSKLEKMLNKKNFKNNFNIKP